MSVHVFVRLSPSRVEKFLECNARWGFAELPGGTPEPGNEATEFGTWVHQAHEQRYKFGKPYDLETRAGWVAAAMAPELPAVLPHDGGAELELTYDVGGVTLRGTLDLCWPDYDRRVAIVRDYKTTGGFGWAKLERDALFGHTQAPLYCLMMMNRHGFDRAFAGWLYALRPPLGPAPWQDVQVKRSDHYITRAEATDRVHVRMLPPAVEMQAYADAGMTAADAHKLPKNLTACRKYNRWCPFVAKCQPEKDPIRMNAFLQSIASQQTAGAPPAESKTADGLPPSGEKTAEPTPPAGAAPPPADKPAVNPPESADPGNATRGKKGKKTDATVELGEVSIDAIAERVADKLALRLARGVQ